jgi:hypothetical protein
MLSCRFDVQLKKDLHSTVVVICQLASVVEYVVSVASATSTGGKKKKKTWVHHRFRALFVHGFTHVCSTQQSFNFVDWPIWNFTWDGIILRETTAVSQVKGGKISIRFIHHRTLWWTVVDMKQSQSSWLVSPHHLETFSPWMKAHFTATIRHIQGRETIFWFYKSFSGVLAWLNELNSGISVHLPVASADTEHKIPKDWTWGMPCRQIIRPKWTTDHKFSCSCSAHTPSVF